MNNAELIDGLRCCAESTNVVETCAIEDCPYHPHSWSCIDDMLRDAADALEAAEKRIAEMPKEGEWIWDGDTGTYHCSECNATSPREDQDGEYIDCPNYCPSCGAKMRGEYDEQFEKMIAEFEAQLPKEAHWVAVENGHGVCSNCNRQDSIDNMATHCRYCGAKMKGANDEQD